MQNPRKQVNEMDDIKNQTSQKETSERPTVNKQDVTPMAKFTPHAAFNDFLLRLENLKQHHPEHRETYISFYPTINDSTFL